MGEVKLCKTCGVEKDLTEFHFRNKSKGLLESSCRNCRNDKSREYYINNKDSVSRQQANYYLVNKDVVLNRCKKYREENREREQIRHKIYNDNNREEKSAYDAEYYLNNKEEKLMQCKIYRVENREKIRNYMQGRYSADEIFRLKQICRGRIRAALAGNSKSSTTLELLGCDVEFFKEWIEFNMEDGMTWENIHIDHIRPCASFDLSDPEQQKQCFVWWNHQPLLAEDNLSKGAKRDKQLEKEMRQRAFDFYHKSHLMNILIPR